MRWLVIAMALAAGGCATEVGPSTAELKARWDADNVFPQNYRGDLTAYMRTYLNDPAHVRSAEVSEPKLKSYGQGDRYVTCVRYDARKTDGKYGGNKEGVAIYVAGKLDRYLDQPREVRPFCSDAAYMPFPEMQTLQR